ncbi:uncharacterized protein TNIN_423851 [Trichonephila inaurata madagascariensis]|uniref:Uncharacterized protein n=1 Tax=Trichonephila inaurata madagascariensis TaxID=2747483 RepID=A0A8X6IKL4_9ARAC|nr:uncharacterized protein TNIN_423851 [Trichonephila inaurata madagascariensis]
MYKQQSRARNESPSKSTGKCCSHMEKNFALRNVRSWCCEFEKGRKNLQDNEHLGWSCSSLSNTSSPGLSRVSALLLGCTLKLPGPSPIAFVFLQNVTVVKRSKFSILIEIFLFQKIIVFLILKKM